MFSEPLPSACCSVMVAVVSGGILVGVLFPDPQLVHPGCPVWIHTWGRCNSEESVGVVTRLGDKSLGLQRQDGASAAAVRVLLHFGLKQGNVLLSWRILSLLSSI